jgi:hypothetical protein
MMRGTCSRKGSCFTQRCGSLPPEQREHGAMETLKICPTPLCVTSRDIQSIGQVISRIRTSASRRKANELTHGDEGGSQGHVARSASVYPMATTTAGISSVTKEASSMGSSILLIQHMVDLTEIDLDLPVVAGPVVTRRGASSGSQNGPIGASCAGS